MNNDMSSFVERYQLLYEKDPQSKVFAPLAEAYRRMGLVDEAIDLAVEGVKQHPHFASGRVALGKCYVQKGEHEKAIEQLKIAVELSPENLLAHQLLAESLAKMRRPDEALNEFKMVLFLNPNDARAAQVVKKLEEALYADEAGEADEEFAMERIKEVSAHKASDSNTEISLKEKTDLNSRDFEQALALLDTRFDRGDWVLVRQQLEELLTQYPDHPELIQRKSYLDELTQNSFSMGEFLTPLKTDLQKSKVEKLKRLLERIESRRKA